MMDGGIDMINMISPVLPMLALVGVMNQVYTIVLMLALVGFALTVQTAHGEDVIRLQNGTMVPNTLGVGAPNSEGITLLSNGTYGAYVNGALGSQIGPVLVRDYHNGTITANSDMSAWARDNESDSNSTSNMTDPSSNSTQNIDVTEDVCHRMKKPDG
jgi:hypothetical protein